MPIQSIDIGSYLKAGYDPLNGAMSIAQNVCIDKAGGVRRRPAVSAFSEAPSTAIDSYGIDLVHVTNDGKIYVIGGYNPSLLGRDIYAVAAGSVVKLSGVSNGQLLGDRRPLLVETEALLVAVAGGLPQKIVLADNSCGRLANCTYSASHVVANNLRLLLNDVLVDKTKVSFSEVAQGLIYTGHEIWGVVPYMTSGFITAEARPDPVVALGELTNSVLVFGTSSLQVYSSDDTWVYAPVNTLENGCLASYSVIRCDDTYAWLDQYRRFVMSDGKSVTVLSDHIAPALADVVNPASCYGYRVRTKFVDCLVWTFPDDGRTYALDSTKGWSTWCTYDPVNKVNTALAVTSAVYDSTRGLTLVGTPDGYLRCFTHDRAGS
jgi:hypothetical protein